MAMRPKRPCSYPGCRELVESGRCERHKGIEKREYDKRRPAYYDWYKTARWQRERIAFLWIHPLCECDECKQLPVPLPANVVDHKIPHKGNYNLFWDHDNWQAMNKRCHDKKTARENGGFGNGR